MDLSRVKNVLKQKLGWNEFVQGGQREITSEKQEGYQFVTSSRESFVNDILALGESSNVILTFKGIITQAELKRMVDLPFEVATLISEDGNTYFFLGSETSLPNESIMIEAGVPPIKVHIHNHPKSNNAPSLSDLISGNRELVKLVINRDGFSEYRSRWGSDIYEDIYDYLIDQHTEGEYPWLENNKITEEEIEAKIDLLLYEEHERAEGRLEAIKNLSYARFSSWIIPHYKGNYELQLETIEGMNSWFQDRYGYPIYIPSTWEDGATDLDQILKTAVGSPLFDAN